MGLKPSIHEVLYKTTSIRPQETGGYAVRSYVPNIFAVISCMFSNWIQQNKCQICKRIILVLQIYTSYAKIIHPNGKLLKCWVEIRRLILLYFFLYKVNCALFLFVLLHLFHIWSYPNSSNIHFITNNTFKEKHAMSFAVK